MLQLLHPTTKELFGEPEALKVMQAFNLKVCTVFSTSTTSSSRSQGLVEKYNGTVTERVLSLCCSLTSRSLLSILSM